MVELQAGVRAPVPLSVSARRAARGMLELVDASDIRAFMARDWARVAEAKASCWAERKRRLGPAEGLRIADELRRQALLVAPDWPDASERASDYSAHVALARRLSDASPRCSG